MNMSQSIRCRSCAGEKLIEILSLGSTPLANSLLTFEQLDEAEAKYPLELVFCPDCTLVQITETVPPEKLFREYFYFSSFSDTVLEHARELAKRVVESRHLNGNSLVIEVASNDGYLLQNYKRAGIAVLGIEPAVNIARVAREQVGIATISDFFDEPLARKLAGSGQSADVLHAHNVLAHVANLNGFVSGIALVLKAGGMAVIEVPYVKDMIQSCEFDTIYHEHLCYFSLTALRNLFQRHELFLRDVFGTPIHGGSLQVYVEKTTSDKEANPSERVKLMLEMEREIGMGQAAFYLGFRLDVEKLRHDLLALLHDLKRQGKSIAVYGASAKGSTLLNYFGIGNEILDFVVDRSTVKQGLFTPGTHLPIYSPEKLIEAMPDYVILLTWNFANEVLEQQAEYRRRGGQFIIPIPEIRLV